LLPYGHLIEIEKLREWENEPDKIKELKGKIEKLEKKPNKTQEEEQELLDKKKKLEALNNNLFQKALCDVMKVGVMNGYGEFLT
jgi:hypothetical protein